MSAKVTVKYKNRARGEGVNRAVMEVQGSTSTCAARLILELDAWPARAFAGDCQAAQIACARQMLLDALDALAGDAAVELVEAGAAGTLAGSWCGFAMGWRYLKGLSYQSACERSTARATAALVAPRGCVERLHALAMQRAAQLARAGHRGRALAVVSCVEASRALAVEAL